MGCPTFSIFGYIKEKHITKREEIEVREILLSIRFNSIKDLPGNDPTPLGIVRDFVDLLPTGNYVIFCDSWFGSLALANELLRRNRYFLLMCKSNRPTWLFQDLLHVRLAKGATKTAIRNDKKMLALCFKDRKVVNIITNVATECDAATRTGKIKPQAVQQYSLHMNALDRFDRQHTLYLMRHRRRKWTTAYIYSMIKFAVHNARLIWNHSHPPCDRLSLYDFLIELINDLAPKP